MKNNIWTWIRVIVYISIIFVVAFYVREGLYIKCHFVELFGVPCPTCGATRATISMVNGDIINAIIYNAFYSLVILPSFIFFMVEDIFVIVKRSILNTPSISLIEVLLGGKI